LDKDDEDTDDEDEEIEGWRRRRTVFCCCCCCCCCGWLCMLSVITIVPILCKFVCFKLKYSTHRKIPIDNTVKPIKPIQYFVNFWSDFEDIDVCFIDKEEELLGISSIL